MRDLLGMRPLILIIIAVCLMLVALVGLQVVWAMYPNGLLVSPR